MRRERGCRRSQEARPERRWRLFPEVPVDRGRRCPRKIVSNGNSCACVDDRDAICANDSADRSVPGRQDSPVAAIPAEAALEVKVRRLRPTDVTLIADIDRSEHVEVQYRVEDGHIVETPVVMADISPWHPNGSGPHSVASHITFCSAVLADGATFLGAFDREADLMGLATVHPTFEPPLAWLATLHVSRAHRRRGAASALWNAGAALASEAGARSLYVSATPTGSAVGFYLSRGCQLADPMHPRLFAEEPEDIHLICSMNT